MDCFSLFTFHFSRRLRAHLQVGNISTYSFTFTILLLLHACLVGPVKISCGSHYLFIYSSRRLHASRAAVWLLSWAPLFIYLSPSRHP